MQVNVSVLLVLSGWVRRLAGVLGDSCVFSLWYGQESWFVFFHFFWGHRNHMIRSPSHFDCYLTKEHARKPAPNNMGNRLGKAGFPSRKNAGLRHVRTVRGIFLTISQKLRYVWAHLLFFFTGIGITVLLMNLLIGVLGLAEGKNCDCPKEPTLKSYTNPFTWTYDMTWVWNGCSPSHFIVCPNPYLRSFSGPPHIT